MGKKLCLTVLSLMFCLSATACVGVPGVNFGMEIAGVYATLDEQAIFSRLPSGGNAPLALAFDRALAGLGEFRLVPLSSVGKNGVYEVRMQMELTREGQKYSRIHTYRLTYEQDRHGLRAVDWTLAGLEPFSGTAEEGVRAFLEAVSAGDAARVAGLSDIWSFFGEREAFLQEICLALLRPVPLREVRVTAQEENVLAEFTADGLARSLLFLPRWDADRLCFTVQPAGFDLSSPEAACQSHLTAFAAFDAAALTETLSSLSETEAAALRVRLITLQERYRDLVRIGAVCRGFEPSVEEEDRTVGLLHAEILLIFDSRAEKTPLTAEVELVRSGGAWRLKSSPLPQLSASDPAFGESSEEMIKAYFVALNSRNVLNILSVFTLGGLTDEQAAAVRRYYSGVADRDEALNYRYGTGRLFCSFSTADYAEYVVEYMVYAGDRLEVSGEVCLDVLFTDEGWRLLPENSAFEQEGVPRPDHAGLSPKHGLLRYLELLPCGEADRILDCFDLSGLSEAEAASFRQTVESYALNTWNSYACEFVRSTSGSYGIRLEAILRINGELSSMQFDMTAGADGIWRILARTQYHMYTQDG